MEIEIDDRYSETGKSIVLFDEEDYRLIKHFNILTQRQENLQHIKVYLNTQKKKTVSVGKFIWETYNGDTELWIDHINGNTYDNRKENLRAITPKENSINRKIKNPYGISGIYLKDRSKEGRTNVFELIYPVKDGKPKKTTFKSLHDAIRFRYNAEQEVYGDISRMTKSLEDILNSVEDIRFETKSVGQHPNRSCEKCGLKILSSFHKHTKNCIHKLIKAIGENPHKGDILECCHCQEQYSRSHMFKHIKTHKT